MKPATELLNTHPTAAIMASAAMVDTLAAQARALWPQESVLIGRYDLPISARILDAGCGTGEATVRLADLFPLASVLGVDILESRVNAARSNPSNLKVNAVFEQGDVFGLMHPSATFDLTVCRHVLQSISEPDRAISELLRVTKPGGYIHLLAEDLDMVHFERGTPGAPDLREFWHALPATLGVSLKADLLGRHVVGLLTALSLEEIKVDYLVADTLRVPRSLLAEIFQGWWDILGGEISKCATTSSAAVASSFRRMIDDALDPARYVAWLVPVISARVPARLK
jgi:SAM-dependent methyltransferase